MECPKGGLKTHSEIERMLMRSFLFLYMHEYATGCIFMHGALATARARSPIFALYRDFLLYSNLPHTATYLPIPPIPYRYTHSPSHKKIFML